MNAEQTIRSLLGALGDVNRLFRDHAVRLERRSDVRSAKTKVEVVNYQHGAMVEGFVEAEMNDGTALCWCLEITWTDDAFRIEATLDRNSNDRAETLDRLAPKILHDAEELPGTLGEVARALLSSGPR